MRIGRYETIRVIGRGAMGVVFEARDVSLGRIVALKTLSVAATIPEEFREQFEQRFYREARAAGSVQHPGIVVVYEVGQDDATKTPYMALEFLHGRPLDTVLSQEGALPWQEALRIVARIAEALEVAHAQGIVHRDLKPANVMLLASGDTKIMDFGVAKVEASQLTSVGQVLGSPSYMAPEQAIEARADARSDLFSLGSVLYELLTGRRAFPGRGVTEILIRLVNENPAPPSASVPGLSGQVDAVVMRALEKDPAKRYARARDLIEDIEDALAGRAPRHATGGEAPSAAPKLGADTGVAGAGGPALRLPQGKRVTLALVSGPRAGDTYVFDSPSVLIGRQGGAAGLQLDDNQVSRAHAIVECRGLRFTLRDMESTNGTFVDGQPIRELEIQDQQEFQVGATRLMLIVADDQD